jgi:Cu(I)/Ag(I) efflux system membrane fusion protein
MFHDTEDMPMKRISRRHRGHRFLRRRRFRRRRVVVEPVRRCHASAQAATVYTCPMHPDYRSDHPGNCPDLRHAPRGGRAGAASGNDATVAALPHGAVQVSPERQQAIGCGLGVVSRLAGTQRLRTTGRVVADENRTYPIVAALSGWIRDVESVATGDAVKKDQVLASFSAPDSREFESEQRSYYTGLEMLYRLQSAQPAAHDWRRSLEGIERMADGLRNMGVSNSQIREMGKRRELVHDIRVESPVDGFVLKRSVSPGLRFDRGFEFYRIAISATCGSWPTCTATRCRSSAAAPPRGSPWRTTATRCRRR